MTLEIVDVAVILVGWAVQLAVFGWWARGREADLRLLIATLSADIAQHKSECVLIREHQARQATDLLTVVKDGQVQNSVEHGEIRREQKEHRDHLEKWIAEEHKEHATLNTKLDMVVRSTKS